VTAFFFFLAWTVFFCTAKIK